MKSFFIKVIMYSIILGLPLSMVAFLVLGIVWLAKQIF